MDNQEIIDAKPRDIIEINGINFYVLAELKTDKSNYVELSSLLDAKLIFAAKKGDIIIPITDENLILALAQEMAPEARGNAQLLMSAAKNASKIISGK